MNEKNPVERHHQTLTVNVELALGALVAEIAFSHSLNTNAIIGFHNDPQFPSPER